jgi:hypothetical protein
MNFSKIPITWNINTKSESIDLSAWKKLFQEIRESDNFFLTTANYSQEDFLNLIQYIEDFLVKKISKCNQNTVLLINPIDDRFEISDALLKLRAQKSLIDEIIVLKWIRTLAEIEIQWITIKEKARYIIEDEEK